MILNKYFLREKHAAFHSTITKQHTNKLRLVLAQPNSRGDGTIIVSVLPHSSDCGGLWSSKTRNQCDVTRYGTALSVNRQCLQMQFDWRLLL